MGTGKTRFGEIELGGGPDQRQPTDNLNRGPVLPDGAGQRVDAHRCGKRDQTVAQHDPYPCGQSPEKAPLNTALQSQQVCWPERQRNQHTDYEADRHDEQQMWYDGHHGVATARGNDGAFSVRRVRSIPAIRRP